MGVEAHSPARCDSTPALTTALLHNAAVHSPANSPAGVKPIRGGIPIAFPQFASQGPLPQHGFARTAAWVVDEVGDGIVALSLTDNDATRALWPHAFKLVLRAQFDGGRLATHLEVTNPAASGALAAAPFAFEALQHSYFYAGPGDDAAAQLRLSGLGGVTYLSKPQGGAAFVQPPDGDAAGSSAPRGFALEGEVDRIYCDTR
jgi:glucose-6-phosphate 1-epimerase